MGKVDLRLFVKLSALAFVLEASLLVGLIQVQPQAGPHQTILWVLVLAQVGGVWAAAAFVAPLQKQLSPFLFECVYYAVVFVVQMAILEAVAMAVAKAFGKIRPSNAGGASPVESDRGR